ncbi:small nuclear ribonucleoprotein (snRNP)-like protein [Rhodopirellula rubra]|uniref:Small nuclear ribonucleoprotein (SnRNP)-like protein n=1 Tax=Aporhodopirellula rubra TaxID=980271 RepID=A0A7W5E156_9BACT|nr:hypothetical protein [Aporhodopirellula rubra]MBB3207912.1 small nuclear ribonucleoprotein (snRNP)-like protein [Aporhodopirellula rubra]
MSHRCAVAWVLLLSTLLATSVTTKTMAQESPEKTGKPESVPSVELDLKSVTLHAAGKGWFEYTGTVKGAGVFRVPVGEFEIDEAIRVSRLSDPVGDGKIRIASPVDPVQPMDSVPSTRTFGDLLVSMKGQSIEASMHDGSKVDGVLVAVEQHTDLVGEASVDREYITILTKRGLQSQRVEKFSSIRPTDAGFVERLETTLAEEGRPNELPVEDVEFVFADGPAREVSVGVMRSVPMWKVSYRIDGNALIHRSIVDNTSGVDWTNVQLHLLDGSPVLFTMNLRSVTRARLRQLKRPSSHAAVAPSFEESFGGLHFSASESMASGSEWDNMDAMMGEPFGGMGMGMGGMGGAMGGSISDATDGGEMSPIPGRRDSDELALAAEFESLNRAISQTQDAPAGSTMQMQFDSVDLESGKTALLDTLISPVSIEEVSVYRESYHPTATLLSLEIENNTTALLPSGPLSVLAGEQQRAILGEVVLPALGPNSKRLVGYAMDGGVRVIPTSSPMMSDTESISIDDERHLIEVTTLHHRTRSFEVINRSGDDRNIVLEIPLSPPPFEFQIDEPEKQEITVEKTEGFARVRFSVADGQSRHQQTSDQRTHSTSSSWGTVPSDDLERWLANEKWDDGVRAKLREILDLRDELERVNGTLGDLLAMRKELISEIERVSNQFTRSANDVSLPQEVLARYQTRILNLETRREQAEQRMTDLAETRRNLLDSLGMPRQLPPELSPLRAFVPDTDLIPSQAATPSQTSDDASNGKPQSDDEPSIPFGLDPFGN